MLNIKKLILSTTLAMAIIAPNAVYAGTLNNVTPKCDMKVSEKNSVTCKCDTDCCKDKKDCCKDKKDSMCKKDEKTKQKHDKLEAKIKLYDKTLQSAEKYVPGTVAKGDVAANKTKELVKQIIDIRKEKIDVATLPLKSEYKAEVTAIEQKVAKGEITKQEAKVQLTAKQQEKVKEVKVIKDGFKNENKSVKDSIKIKKNEVIVSFKNFETSIKSKDAKVIENTFNIYLQNINELNNMLQQLVIK